MNTGGNTEGRRFRRCQHLHQGQTGGTENAGLGHALTIGRGRHHAVDGTDHQIGNGDHPVALGGTSQRNGGAEENLQGQQHQPAPGPQTHQPPPPKGGRAHMPGKRGKKPKLRHHSVMHAGEGPRNSINRNKGKHDKQRQSH
uniref:Uncharacterized protein n=1 Tax=Magnetospirillum gryphiswaldense TaxID=55518 RepID=A4U5N5_9PROT|nr:hypothetical protein MGR_4260 [Magnetospirillum gryphiswaldense MSR-1]